MQLGNYQMSFNSKRGSFTSIKNLGETTPPSLKKDKSFFADTTQIKFPEVKLGHVKSLSMNSSLNKMINFPQRQNIFDNPCGENPFALNVK